jgi:hypothetical protein
MIFSNSPSISEKIVLLGPWYDRGVEDSKAQEFIKNFGSVYMGISGAEADKSLGKWQSVTTWLLQDAGATKFSPDKFAIPKP